MLRKGPGIRWDSEPKELREGPLMVGKPSSHGGSTMNPVLLGVGKPDRQTQAVMKVVQVIQATHNEHTGLKQFNVVS